MYKNDGTSIYSNLRKKIKLFLVLNYDKKASKVT